jgi:hypothetical protein
VVSCATSQFVSSIFVAQSFDVKTWLERLVVEEPSLQSYLDAVCSGKYPSSSAVLADLQPAWARLGSTTTQAALDKTAMFVASQPPDAVQLDASASKFVTVELPGESVFGSRVVDVACGDYFTVVLTATGSLFILGVGNQHDVGVGPHRVPLAVKATKVCASHDSIAVLDKQGGVWHVNSAGVVSEVLKETPPHSSVWVGHSGKVFAARQGTTFTPGQWMSANVTLLSDASLLMSLPSDKDKRSLVKLGMTPTALVASEFKEDVAGTVFSRDVLCQSPLTLAIWTASAVENGFVFSLFKLPAQTVVEAGFDGMLALPEFLSLSAASSQSAPASVVVTALLGAIDRVSVGSQCGLRGPVCRVCLFTFHRPPEW